MNFRLFQCTVLILEIATSSLHENAFAVRVFPSLLTVLFEPVTAPVLVMAEVITYKLPAKSLTGQKKNPVVQISHLLFYQFTKGGFSKDFILFGIYVALKSCSHINNGCLSEIWKVPVLFECLCLTWCYPNLVKEIQKWPRRFVSDSMSVWRSKFSFFFHWLITQLHWQQFWLSWDSFTLLR